MHRPLKCQKWPSERTLYVINLSLRNLEEDAFWNYSYCKNGFVYLNVFENYYSNFFQAFQDSGYGGRVKRPSSSATTDKENFSPTLNTTGMSSSGSNNANSKARKSLASNWAPHDDSFSAPETPSKSLVGTSDASMLFSPPGKWSYQIIKD